MKIAVPYENGNIKDSFEKSPIFKIYTVEKEGVTASDIAFVDAENKQSPVKLLVDNGVSTVIGKNFLPIGIMTLMRAGIEIIGGREGDADRAVEEYIKGTLVTEEKTTCGHNCADCGRDCPSRK